MKNAVCLTLVLLILASGLNCVSNASINKNPITNMKSINIIPKPSSIAAQEGFVSISNIKRIIVDNNLSDEKYIAELFRSFLTPIKEIEISLTENNEKERVFVSLSPDYDIPEEGYVLVIGEGQTIDLKASSASGLFYGFQSFRQLCDPGLEAGSKPENTTIPICTIEDSPVFGYRGMHLDVSRHFFNVEFVKTYIDMIALHKMNVFHWHLTDDNGWRIEIDKYPLLTEKSAWRVDRRHEPWKEQSPPLDNEVATYGGYYTKDQIREVVEYASKRNIVVIPEIEMPGHTSEVFAAYPELSCKGDYIPVNPGSYWPNTDIFCAGNDKVFTFLENVLEEVIDLFPGRYIHIGGDEADKMNWEKCPKCQARIESENLKDEHELQSWFIKRIEKFILSKDRKLVGWDEILEGGLAKSATVMSWRGMDGGIESAKAGHDVIMCPTSHCYFDYYQANPETSPKAFGGYTTLKKVYSFDPVPPELSNEEAKFILGGQGNLWTEYVQTPDRAQYRVLPRMSALSEVLWSGPGSNSYEDFYSRLKRLLLRFDVMGWVYAPGSFFVNILSEQAEDSGSYAIKLISEKPGEEIRYTTDGSLPVSSSALYENPIILNKKTTIKAALFIDQSIAGKVSEKTIFFSKAIGKKTKYITPYSNRYTGAGIQTLVNGLTGTIAHNDGYWQGWLEENLEVIIDLDKEELIGGVSLGFLESHGVWIFLPTSIEVSFSKDGKTYEHLMEIEVNDGEKNGTANRVTIQSEKMNQSARYIKIVAINRGVCPDWHPGAGGKSWVFADEIFIE